MIERCNETVETDISSPLDKNTTLNNVFTTSKFLTFQLELHTLTADCRMLILYICTIVIPEVSHSQVVSFGRTSLRRSAEMLK